MDGFTRELLARLPLAQAVLLAWKHTVEAEFLQEIFENHRGRCYEQVLGFDVLVHLVADALLEHGGSGRRAFQRAEERKELPVSKQAAYGKLRRIPIELSNAFLSRCTDRLGELFPRQVASPVPASLRDFEVVVLDGKKVKRAAKRLKPLRGVQGKPLGGKVLVAMSLASGLAVAMNADPDGEVNDCPLVPGLLPQVRSRLEGRRLWVADRQFGDLVQPRRFAAAEDAFLVRYHPKAGFYPDPSVPAREGVEVRARRYREEWGWLGAARNKQRLYVRRITLFRPDEEDVLVLTNLLDADAYPASDLLETYLMRWGIERMFQKVTEVFQLQSLIGSSPQAAVFQCAFCLVLYNLIQVVRALLAESQHRPPETISSENLFYDVQRELTALSVLGNRTAVVEFFAPPRTGSAVAERLRTLLTPTWTDRWIKAPTNKRRRKTKLRPVPGGHTSVFRILEAYRRAQKAKQQRRK